ncbi:MAG: sodium:solute symporter family protein [Acidobacteriaceae bacterium]
MNFTILDWSILIVYLAISMAAGLYGRKWVSGISDFLVAGRGLGTYIGVATLAATEIGTITFMYYAQLGYTAGYSSFIVGLISGLVMIFVGRSGFVVRKLRDLQLMTVPEYFEVRYSRRLRIFAGLLISIGGILNMGVFLRIEGTFLALISGTSLDYLKLIMTGVLLLELAYTVLGGMVSIVITDFIQFVALSTATVLITLYSIHVAGWARMHDAVAGSMGKGGFSPLANPTYGWSFILFQVLYWLAVDTCWQTTAMRTFSTVDSKVSRKVFTWTGFLFLGRGMMPMLWGIAALAVIGPGHDSLQAMPMFLAKILPAGIRGLVAAGMLAATMSVNSSYLLGWSSIIAQDVIVPARQKPLSSRAQVVLNRVCNVSVSLFILFWGIWYTLPGPAYFYLNMTAIIALAGSFSGIVAGLYWRRSNVLGGYLAMIGGLAGAVGFFLFHWPVNYAGFGSFALAALGMVAGSLLGPANSKREMRGVGVAG